jgi:hypothetical protein
MQSTIALYNNDVEPATASAQSRKRRPSAPAAVADDLAAARDRDGRQPLTAPPDRAGPVSQRDTTWYLSSEVLSRWLGP